MVRLDLEMERSARLAGLVDAIRDGIPFRLRPLVLGYIRTRFFRKIYNFFPQMTTFFRKQMESSIEFAGPMDQTPDRTYPILETFLFLITKRRFGGVGAPEGRKIAPDILIQHSSAKLVFMAFHYG